MTFAGGKEGSLVQESGRRRSSWPVLSCGMFDDRAGLETLGLVHEHKFVIILRAKSAGFSNLRYTRIESTSVGCSARLADYIDTEGVGVVQQTGIPGEVRNLDQDVPWVLTVTFCIGRRPTRSTTGTARPCKSVSYTHLTLPTTPYV